MYQNEISTFHRPPGEVQQLRCRACGAVCRVSRGALGPTCYAEALAGHKRPHYRFSCPRAAEHWHAEAQRLYIERQRTPSRWLATVMQLELAALLAFHPRRQAAKKEVRS